MKLCKKCSRCDYSKEDQDYVPDLSRYIAKEQHFPQGPPFAVRTYYHPAAVGDIVCRVEHMLEPFGPFVPAIRKESV